MAVRRAPAPGCPSGVLEWYFRRGGAGGRLLRGGRKDVQLRVLLALLAGSIFERDSSVLPCSAACFFSAFPSMWRRCSSMDDPVICSRTCLLQFSRWHVKTASFTPFVGVFPSLSFIRAAIMLIMWRSRLAFGDARHFRKLSLLRLG